MKIEIKKFLVLVCLLAGLVNNVAGQEKTVESTSASIPEKYEFKLDQQIACTPVKSQDNTGTCWSFATASFIESELLRQGKGEHNLSEMFVVRNIYQDKAQNFLLRQGKANFGEGALAHDYLNAAKQHGLVPDEVYSGLNGQARHDHSEMEAVLESVLGTFSKQRSLSPKWKEIVNKVMDSYLGPAPAEFSYQGKDYTPESFAKAMGFNANDYVNLTSYSHHPFGDKFVLEIPDNYSNGSFQNMPIDDLVATIDRALDSGFSVAWDGDVSERGFLRQQGLAVLPAPSNGNFAAAPGEELKVSQEMRQETFENLSTTDDHLMHLVGRAHDQLGNKYYLIKNSWGEVGEHQGYLYMSEAYVRLKTVAVLVHKDALTTPDGGGKSEGTNASGTKTETPKVSGSR